MKTEEMKEFNRKIEQMEKRCDMLESLEMGFVLALIALAAAVLYLQQMSQ